MGSAFTFVKDHYVLTLSGLVFLTCLVNLAHERNWFVKKISFGGASVEFADSNAVKPPLQDTTPKTTNTQYNTGENSFNPVINGNPTIIINPRDTIKKPSKSKKMTLEKPTIDNRGGNYNSGDVKGDLNQIINNGPPPPTVQLLIESENVPGKSSPLRGFPLTDCFVTTAILDFESAAVKNFIRVHCEHDSVIAVELLYTGGGVLSDQFSRTTSQTQNPQSGKYRARIFTTDTVIDIRQYMAVVVDTLVYRP